MSNKNVSDCLIIGVDFSEKEKDILMVMKREGSINWIVNMLEDDEAREIYDKLIGRKEKCCKTCKYYKEVKDIYNGLVKFAYCNHEKHIGDYVQPYTVCDDYK